MVAILLVEDNDSLARLYNISLTADGYTVIHTTSCQETEQVLASAIPDIAVLDMNLPDGTGLAVAQFIRSSPRLGNIPIIMVTASPLTRDDVVQYRIDHLLRKPVSLPFLSALIKQIATPTVSNREKISVRAK